MEDEYKSNSFKSKGKEIPDHKNVEKVTTKPAKTKKKSEVRKIAEVFMPDDVDNVRNYIFEDILIPAVKNIVMDAVEALLGLNRSHSSSYRSSGSRESYSAYYHSNKDKDDRHASSRKRTIGYDYEEVICDNRGDAEELLDRMLEMIDQYGNASVADLYDLAGITGNYTDNKYGWEDKYDIQRATVVRLREGYLIKLPRPMPLN